MLIGLMGVPEQLPWGRWRGGAALVVTFWIGGGASTGTVMLMSGAIPDWRFSFRSTGGGGGGRSLGFSADHGGLQDGRQVALPALRKTGCEGVDHQHVKYHDRHERSRAWRICSFPGVVGTHRCCCVLSFRLSERAMRPSQAFIDRRFFMSAAFPGNSGLVARALSHAAFGPARWFSSRAKEL